MKAELLLVESFETQLWGYYVFNIWEFILDVM